MVDFSLEVGSQRWRKTIGPQIYRFPINNQDDYKGTITFTVLKTDYESSAKSVARTLRNVSGTDFGLSPEEALMEQPVAPRQFNTQRADVVKPRKTNKKVTLYLPTSIVYIDNVDYSNTTELGVVGAATAAALRGGSNYLGAAASALSNVAGNFTSLYDAATAGIQSETANIAMLRTVGRVSAPIRAAVETTAGLTLNPNKRSTLRGVAIRSFNFTFKLIPESRREAREIEYIIELFRKELYPEDIIEGGLPVGYRYPNKFAIEMFYDRKRVATKILPCFLQNFTTNYNPNSMSMHHDGKFPEIDIQMSFTEDRTLRKQDIEEGY